jgi:uncharacterized linocin/CFP29 family protein
MDAQMDVFSQDKGFSNPELASMIGTRFSVHAMRPYWYKGRPWVNSQVGVKDGKPVFKKVPVANATLQRDEWIEIDRVVMKTARERLVGVADLFNAGLTYNISNAMGKTVLEYQDMNDPGSANISMDGATMGQGDRPKYLTKYLPIPIIHGDFTLDQRSLEASRNSGDSLDTTMIEAVTRRVSEKLEDLLFTDTSFTYGGGTIYSYISDTNKNTVSLSANWNASDKTGAQILEDVQGMKQALINAKHFGPFMVYIPTAYDTVMGDDYATGYPKSIKQRLMEIDGLIGIKVADRLSANTVVMVSMNSSTVRMVNGFSPRVVQWSSQGGMVHHFKVMTIQVPQIRADQSGNSGLCVLS